MTLERSLTGVYVKLALVAATWGSTFIAGRIVSAQMAAPVAALGRFVIATATLLLLVLILEHGLPRLSWRKWLQFTMLGAIGVATYALLFMYALQTVTASRGALIMALIPAATLVGGALFLREPLTRPRVLGIALALIGVAVDLRARVKEPISVMVRAEVMAGSASLTSVSGTSASYFGDSTHLLWGVVAPTVGTSSKST